MKRAVLLGALLCGCPDQRSKPAPTDSAKPAAPTTLEPWTMGVARGQLDLVLPPPCTMRADVLRAALVRSTRLLAEPTTLGRVLIAQGADVPKWKPDAFGIMTMVHGRTPIERAPWPQIGRPSATRAGATWLFSYVEDRRLVLWRAGVREVVATGALRDVDLRCNSQGGCALLLRRASKAEVWLGDASDPGATWHNVHLPESSPYQRLAAVRGSGRASSAIVAVGDDVRVRFVEADASDHTVEVATLSAPHGPLATMHHGRAWAVLRTAEPGRDGCNPQARGVTVATHGGKTTALVSPFAATRASLHPVGKGALVLWLAPPRCGTGLRILYGAILGSDGTVVAPVSTMADASHYAIATDGPNVDMWIAHDRRVTYVRAKCPTPRPKAASK